MMEVPKPEEKRKKVDDIEEGFGFLKGLFKFALLYQI